MFNPAIPLYVRLSSLFHVFVPLLLIWALRRLGYDRRGLLLQTVLTWMVLPVTYLVSPPEWDINWVYGFFGKPQTHLAPRVFLALCMIVYPLVLYAPTHALLVWMCRRAGIPCYPARP
jgi:hypothetical protein